MCRKVSAKNPATDGVSVIIPVYNRERYLDECIHSVKSQETDFPVEIILADDGSTDKSKEIAVRAGSGIAGNQTFIWLNKPADVQTQGAAPTRNRGIAMAKYKYIAFLDSDDMFLPGHLQRLYDAMEAHPDAAFAFDEEMMGNADFSEKWTLPYPPLTGREKINEVFLGIDFFVHTNSIMLRKSSLETVKLPDGGYFDTELSLGEDIDLWLRITEKFPYVFTPGYGSVIREHSARSVTGKRDVYKYQKMVLHRAIQRYPYSRKIMNSRRAIIHYRLAECDFAEKKYLSAFCRLLYAGILSPKRAVQTVLQQLHVIK